MFSRKRRAIFAAGALIAAAALAAGCGSDDDDAKAGEGGKLSGAVVADGSSTVFPIMQAVAEEFRGDQGDVEVSVGESGTGGGFEKFCRGETDISNASRPIKDEEIEACETGGVEYVELPVAKDGLSVVVHPSNDDVDCLTIDQLKAIWEPDSKVKTWKDVDPAWSDDEIKLYGPGTSSGTFDYFTDEVVGEEGASRTDYTASEDDNVLVQGVAGDESALGYFGYGYYVENKDKLKVVEVDSGDGCVEPTQETIDAGEYAPLSRPLFIYVSRKGAEKEQVAAFVDYALETADTLAPDVGFVTRPDEQATTANDDWAAFRDGGTPAADDAAAEDAAA